MNTLFAVPAHAVEGQNVREKPPGSCHISCRGFVPWDRAHADAEWRNDAWQNGAWCQRDLCVFRCGTSRGRHLYISFPNADMQQQVDPF